MNMSYTLQFNADRDAVLERFCDPEHYARHQDLMGNTEFEQLEHEDDGTVCRIKFKYRVASDVPAFAKKVLGDSSQVVQEETWDRSTGRGRISVDVATLPGTLECQASLEGNEQGCAKRYDWEVKVKLPLIGGKIEKVVADDIRSKSGPDQNAVNQLLGES